MSRVEDRLRVAMHEIRQPVAAVLALAEAAGGHPEVPDDVRRYLHQIVEQTMEVSGAAWSVLETRRARSASECDHVDLDEVLDSVLHAVRLTWSGVLTRRGDAGGMAVRGSRPSLRRCVMNVVDNAVRAAGPDGSVAVSVQCHADVVEVVVEDDGPGFGRVPRGTGVGLAVTRHALQSIGGGISVGHGPGGKGARAVLSLPVWAERADLGGACPHQATA
ncbi:sensor histidine kinase [Geodermatophilus sp. SYSU D01176]